MLDLDFVGKSSKNQRPKMAETIFRGRSKKYTYDRDKHDCVVLCIDGDGREVEFRLPGIYRRIGVKSGLVVR